MPAASQTIFETVPLEIDSTKTLADDWLLWQLADSAFPTGGFAHSSGLEATWQHGELRNAAELKGFVEASLHQFGHSSLPLMLAAFDEPAHFSELDRLCECFLTNHVANRASRLQGLALLASAERIFNLPALKPIREALAGTGPALGHLSPIFGAVVRSLGVRREKAARLFMFGHLRSLFASAVRLGIIGPMEAQTMQHSMAARVEEISQKCSALSAEDISQTTPLLEIWQGAQDRLYSRLFQS